MGFHSFTEKKLAKLNRLKSKKSFYSVAALHRHFILSRFCSYIWPRAYLYLRTHFVMVSKNITVLSLVNHYTHILEYHSILNLEKIICVIIQMHFSLKSDSNQFEEHPSIPWFRAHFC